MDGIIELRILEQAKAFAEKAKLRIDAVGYSNSRQVIAGDVFRLATRRRRCIYSLKDVSSWDDARSIEILKNGHRAMVPSGRVLIIEGVINTGNEPGINKISDPTMMALSVGRQRTATESQKLIDAAGLILWQNHFGQKSVMV